MKAPRNEQKENLRLSIFLWDISYLWKSILSIWGDCLEIKASNSFVSILIRDFVIFLSNSWMSFDIIIITTNL